MSTKAVIAWLLAAILLGLLAIFLLRAPASTPPARPGSTTTLAPGLRLAEFLPGDVRRLSISTPKAKYRQIIEKAPNGRGPLGADAEWLLRMELPTPTGQPAANADGSQFVPPPWPLDPGRVQSLLRALGEARAAGEPKDAPLGDAPTRVLMDLGAGTITWAFSARALAGLTLVEVTGLDGVTRRALCDDKLLRVFTDPGPAPWRITTPAAGIAPDASRVRLEGGRSRAALARVAGQWNLTEPLGAPADPAAVAKLQSALAAIRIADFLDDGAAGVATGLERPAARVTIEADRRTLPPGAAEPTTSTDALDLAIGGPADAPGRRMFCSINDERLVLLDASNLGDVPTDPTRYLWPAPLRVPPADVGGVTLDRLTPEGAVANDVAPAKAYRRSSGRWAELRRDAPAGSAGAEAPLGDKEQRDVDAVVAFLTGGAPSAFPGASPTTPNPVGDARPDMALTAPEGFTPLARVTLTSAAGAPLGIVELWSPKPGMITTRTPATGVPEGWGSRDAAVYRTFPAPRVPALLLDVLGPGGAPSAPAPTPGDALK
jgi:hypothetical protein